MEYGNHRHYVLYRVDSFQTSFQHIFFSFFSTYSILFFYRKGQKPWRGTGNAAGAERPICLAANQPPPSIVAQNA
jgi:hypothetical protein